MHPFSGTGATPRPARGVASREGVDSSPQEVTVEQSGGLVGRDLEQGSMGDAVPLADDQFEAIVVRLNFGIHRPEGCTCSAKIPFSVPDHYVLVRCSLATADWTSPSNRSSTPDPSGSPRSTSPSPASSPTTGPTPEHRRHHHHRLGYRAPDRHPLWRVPLPGRVNRQKESRSRPGTRSGLWAHMAHPRRRAPRDGAHQRHLRDHVDAPHRR